MDKLKTEIVNKKVKFPEYFILLGLDNEEMRVKKFEKYFNKKLVLETLISPSLIDFILHKMNPRHNINQVSNIYRIEDLN